MKHQDFVKHVQGFAQLDSREQAEKAIQATLETLAERIVGDESHDLAEQLPPELAEYLRGHEGETGDAFSLQEFYQRISEREGVAPMDAAIHARAVLAVVRQAVSPDEFEEVRLNLSDDFSELFSDAMPH